MKYCSKCRRTQEYDSFYVDNTHKSLSTYCKSCSNVPLLSPSEYDVLYQSQGGLCATCKQKEKMVRKSSGKPYRLCIDHCHTTGKVRGLLCHSCNIALGKFKDNLDLLEKAYKYLCR